MDGCSREWCSCHQTRQSRSRGTVLNNLICQIQALFFTELDIGQRLATVLGLNDSATRYRNAMNQVKSAFLSRFWNDRDQDLYDHLNPDGSANTQKRPNSIFAITVPLKDNPLIPADKAALVFNSLIKNGLLANHGVRTLSPSDWQYR